MEKQRILIVEDEVIIAEDLKNHLIQLNYSIFGVAYNVDQALDLLEKGQPDLVIIDVQLSDLRDGIDLAHIIRKEHSAPFIFLTSNADIHTIERATQTQPNGYLVKPFNQRSLYAAIEIALNQPQPISDIPEKQTPATHLFLKEPHQYTQIKKEAITWLKADGNYTTIKTLTDRHVVRGKLKEILAQLPQEIIRIHKSYAINLQQAQTVQHSYVKIDGEEIPVGNAYRAQLLEKITLI